MDELTADQLDRLVRSHRRLMISSAVTVGVIIAGVALLVVNDMDFAIRGGAGLGVLIGVLLQIPHRRVVSQLGLTNAEASAILGSRKDQVSGLAAQPPLARARRESIRAKVLLGSGLVLLLVAVIELPYFFGQAGEVHEEGAPSDPAFVASIFLGWGGLLVGLILLMVGNAYRTEAANWRLIAAASDEDSASDRDGTS